MVLIWVDTNHGYSNKLKNFKIGKWKKDLKTGINSWNDRTSKRLRTFSMKCFNVENWLKRLKWVNMNKMPCYQRSIFHLLSATENVFQKFYPFICLLEQVLFFLSILKIFNFLQKKPKFWSIKSFSGNFTILFAFSTKFASICSQKNSSLKSCNWQVNV